ncbi:hypothetical protein HK097_000053 [Rhizophlyctis rosea]|uniref:Uncharacterized protein n=1 Tax=Rhizophlyctis rosea TaxID=64517 RepID=A0AAD5X559_9FUNG|nr:hypothetical protein HK097_000053 [Rhizophlyctis rosea]
MMSILWRVPFAARYVSNSLRNPWLRATSRYVSTVSVTWDIEKSTILCAHETTPGEVSCPTCSRTFPQTDIDLLARHKLACGPSSTSACPLCSKIFKIGDQYRKHIKTCAFQEETRRFEERAAQTRQDAVLAIETGRVCMYPEDQLNARQLYAVEYVKERAKQASAAAMPGLVKSFEQLGYTCNDLARVLDYIRFEAPMIIHFRANNPKLLADTHYRSVEDVNGSTHRRGAEVLMFGPNSYNLDAHKFELVKYGVLNVVNDPSGMQSCYGYGDCHFILSRNVRLRTTFASMDSLGVQGVHFATCEHYAHVLATFSQPELLETIKVATKLKTWGKSSGMFNAYKELQIHGPVLLSRDIDTVVVSAEHTRKSHIGKQLLDFGKRNGTEVKFLCEKFWLT